MRNTDWKWRPRSATWGWNRCPRPVAVRGRTVLPNCRWETVTANCSIMSSLPTSATCADFLPSMSTASTRTTPIWDSAKEPRMKGLARSVLERSSRCPQLGGLHTTDTIGLHSFRDRTLFNIGFELLARSRRAWLKRQRSRTTAVRCPPWKDMFAKNDRIEGSRPSVRPSGN